MSESASVNLGPHLLGRVPAEDSRDFAMREALDSNTPALDRALSDLITKPGAAATTKAFAQAVVDYLKGSAPTPTPPPAPVSSRDWIDLQQLDQGQTGHCVGFGGTQYQNCEPVPNDLTNKDGHDLYYACKVIDGEPKAENGSSVHSLAKALVQDGRIKTYVWAANVQDMKDWLLSRGPIVVGTDWTQDMFNPDAAGFVKPTGDVAGGHCYLIVGYDAEKDAFHAQNSWGRNWGLNGYFFIKTEDFASLLANQGEAMAASELPLA